MARLLSTRRITPSIQPIGVHWPLGEILKIHVHGRGQIGGRVIWIGLTYTSGANPPGRGFARQFHPIDRSEHFSGRIEIDRNRIAIVWRKPLAPFRSASASRPATNAKNILRGFIAAQLHMSEPASDLPTAAWSGRASPDREKTRDGPGWARTTSK